MIFAIPHPAQSESCSVKLWRGVGGAPLCLFATPWTVAHQVLLSMGFPRQEYWIGLPCSPPRNLPDLGMEPTSPVSATLAGRFFTTGPPVRPHGQVLTQPSSFCLYRSQACGDHHGLWNHDVPLIEEGLEPGHRMGTSAKRLSIHAWEGLGDGPTAGMLQCCSIIDLS